MLLLLSPAKTLDYDTPVPLPLRKKATDALFADEAAALIQVLRKKSPAQVARLMDLSDKLAALNVARYRAWQPLAAPGNSKPAVLAFDGDVYDGLRARTLKTADLSWRRPTSSSCRACTARCARSTACSPTGSRWARR